MISSSSNSLSYSSSEYSSNSSSISSKFLRTSLQMAHVGDLQKATKRHHIICNSNCLGFTKGHQQSSITFFCSQTLPTTLGSTLCGLCVGRRQGKQERQPGNQRHHNVHIKISRISCCASQSFEKSLHIKTCSPCKREA